MPLVAVAEPMGAPKAACYVFEPRGIGTLDRHGLSGRFGRACTLAYAPESALPVVLPLVCGARKSLNVRKVRTLV